MDKEIITFENTEVEKHTFHQHKNPIKIYDVNIDRLVVSIKVSFGKKGFRRYLGETKFVLFDKR